MKTAGTTRSICLGIALSLIAVINCKALQTELQVRPRVDQLLAELTLDEKLGLIGGDNKFGLIAVPRLGLRKTQYMDASLGLRMAPESTSFPATIGLAASMNADLANLYGRAIGEEARHWGCDVLLGPGVNLYRVPHCGRNFEYLGADPWLAGTLVTEYIKGLQSCDVGASLKHYVANNTDWQRCNSDSVMNERTLNELYMTPFRMAIQEADPLCIMTSYNLVNGEYPPESKFLIADTLRGKWQFKG